MQIAILYLTIFAKLQILQKLLVCNDNTLCYLMQTALGFCLAGGKRANRNFIYQGTSENLNLIFRDGSVWRQLGTVNAAGSDVKENRPVYSFWKDRSSERGRLVS